MLPVLALTVLPGLARHKKLYFSVSKRQLREKERDGEREKRYLIYACTYSVSDDYGHAVKRTKATAYLIISHHPSCHLIVDGWREITILNHICLAKEIGAREEKELPSVGSA